MSHHTDKQHLPRHGHLGTMHTPITSVAQQSLFKVQKWLVDGDPVNTEQALSLLDVELDSVWASADLKLLKSTSGSTTV